MTSWKIHLALNKLRICRCLHLSFVLQVYLIKLHIFVEIVHFLPRYLVACEKYNYLYDELKFSAPPPIWGRHVEFSISTFSGLVFLLSFILHVFSYNITPPQHQSSYLSVSTHFHVLITTSSSVFLSTWPNHLSLASLILSLMFATPALGLITSFRPSSSV